MAVDMGLKWRERADEFLKGLSWDSVWGGMNSSSREFSQPKDPAALPQRAVRRRDKDPLRQDRRESVGRMRPMFDYVSCWRGIFRGRGGSSDGAQLSVSACCWWIGGPTWQATLTIITTRPAFWFTNTALTSSTPIRKMCSTICRCSPNGGIMNIGCAHPSTESLVPIPINLDTVNLLYGLNLTVDELEGVSGNGSPRSLQSIRTSEDVVVSRVGRDLYEKMFRGYTRKQWGLDPSELDASVTARIPVRFNRDDRYFTDTYQAMPRHGFTRMFENMLDHPNITISLNTDYRDVVKSVRIP